MLIESDVHIEGLLDVCCRSANVNYQAIDSCAHDLEAVRVGESNYGVVVLLGGPEPLSEFPDGEPIAVSGVLWIVDGLQEVIQLRLVTQRQHNSDTHLLCAR